MSLLEIPREIRDKILGFVVLSTINSPPEIPVNSDNGELLPRDDVVRRQGYSCFVGYDALYSHQKGLQRKGIPTLTINHQLRRETLVIMSLLKLPSLRSYKLDVMIIEDDFLWPTWTYVPTTTKMVEEVRVTFRNLDASPRRRTGYHHGDGGPGHLIWSFRDLLERFLHAGPVGRKEKSYEANRKQMEMERVHDKHIKVKHLTLDFQTPAVEAERIAPDFKLRTHRALQELVRLREGHGVQYRHIVNPGTVLKYISEFLGYFSGDFANVVWHMRGWERYHSCWMVFWSRRIS